MYPFVAAALLACSLQATEPKAKPSDYPVSFKADDVEYGVEYMVRTIAHAGRTIVNDDYLVVEIAVYPPAGREVMVSTASFLLRVNGKKDLLHAQTPGIVAASVKYPDWGWDRGLEMEAGAGNAGVILGRRQPIERFPGDQRPASRRLPNPVPRPDTLPAGVEQEPEISPAEMVNLSALPEGLRRKPAAGHVYFAWRGKLSSIKTVELLTRSSSGDVLTRLR